MDIEPFIKSLAALAEHLTITSEYPFIKAIIFDIYLKISKNEIILSQNWKAIEYEFDDRSYFNKYSEKREWSYLKR